MVNGVLHEQSVPHPLKVPEEWGTRRFTNHALSRTIPTMPDAHDLPQTFPASPDHVERGMIATMSGCMFSGKTTHLFRRLEEYGDQSAVIFKHAVDTRYCNDAVVSHAGKSMPAVVVRSSVELCERLPKGIRTVGIDEGHFFDDELVQTVHALAQRGVNVLITMLDRDSWGRVFPIAKKLNAIADDMVMLHATCARCQRPASRTQRLTPIVNGQMVGGTESYEPRCLECWRPPAEPPPIT